MTYEEFERLATNPPEDKRHSVFVLHVLRFDPNYDHEYSECYIHDKCYIHDTLIPFLSYAEANVRMQSLVGREGLHSFKIRQVPLEAETVEGDSSRMWVFDKNGTMIERSYASSIYGDGDPVYSLGFENFRGHPEESIRFHPGDIVEYLNDHNYLSLGVVLYEPYTPGRLWSRVMEHRTEDQMTVDTQFMDYSDDNYIVIDENYKCWGHDMNVQCTDLFPPSMPVPEDMRKRLIEKYEWAKQGN